MKILLLNPPHPSIGSRIPVEHLPPLGLLAIGGPLLDAGHEVQLLDAEFGPLTTSQILAQISCRAPQAVLIGHSGSTSGHPSVVEITRALRAAWPRIWIIYGGVFPTYHWREIMAAEPQIDVIVRGEGEATAVRLMAALEAGAPLASVPGIVYRQSSSGASHFCRTLPTGAFLERGHSCPPLRSGQRPSGQECPRSDKSEMRQTCPTAPDRLLDTEAKLSDVVCATPPAPLIEDLDAYRVGWELIDHARYSYWGNRRAVVAQFSRGCPHRCTYCGQRGFWKRWRHRDPVRFAAELARLHREQGVEVVNFADENPTASRAAWRAFLEALIAEKVRLILVGSTRADDIVRDADLLHLYKKAGVARFLLGMESTDEDTLKEIRKDSRIEVDRQAVRLLRQHGILSMAAYVSGFAEETDRDYWRTLRQMIACDPDQIQSLYVTPHRWTAFYRGIADRRVIQTDLSRWDYKHQVLATRHMPPWRILVWVKLIEAIMQLRPKSLWRVLAHPERDQRAAMRWYYRIGRQVWPYELWHFLFRDRRIKHGPNLAEFFHAEIHQNRGQAVPTPESASFIQSRRLAGTKGCRLATVAISAYTSDMKHLALVRFLLPFAIGFVLVNGCRTTYYAAWEKVGVYKRDLLKKQVAAARDDQKAASEQFKDALTKLKEIYRFEGGALEKAYLALQKDQQRAVEKAASVRDRIREVETVAADLFAEWEKEIGEISTPSLQSASRSQLQETRRRFDSMHAALKQAERSMDSVLTQLKDYVLYLKHNLNAQAIASLKGESANIQTEITRLIAEMNASIAKADEFIKGNP